MNIHDNQQQLTSITSIDLFITAANYRIMPHGENGIVHVSANLFLDNRSLFQMVYDTMACYGNKKKTQNKNKRNKIN